MGHHTDRTDLGREFGATDVVAERGEEGVEKIRELTRGDGTRKFLECVRLTITRVLLLHVFAERERALAKGRRTARTAWAEASEGLIDAAVAVWLAPRATPAPA